MNSMKSNLKRNDWSKNYWNVNLKSQVTRLTSVQTWEIYGKTTLVPSTYDQRYTRFNLCVTTKRSSSKATKFD